jgi:hypothetical protein
MPCRWVSVPIADCKDGGVTTHDEGNAPSVGPEPWKLGRHAPPARKKACLPHFPLLRVGEARLLSDLNISQLTLRSTLIFDATEWLRMYRVIPYSIHFPAPSQAASIRTAIPSSFSSSIPVPWFASWPSFHCSMSACVTQPLSGSSESSSAS